MRWQARYSPAEMIYLEVTEEDVRSYLNNDVRYADHWSFAEVLAGAADYNLRGIFGDETLAELKAAVQKNAAAEPPP